MSQNFNFRAVNRKQKYFDDKKRQIAVLVSVK